MDEFYLNLRQRLSSKAFQTLSLRANELIFAAGEPSRAYYYVLTGEILMRRVLESGDFVGVHKAGPNKFLAEASLFSDHYHCEAVANSASEIVSISKDHMLKALREDVHLSLDFSAALAKNLREQRQNLEIRSIKNAQLRVYRAMQLDMTQTSLKAFASSIGLTHEACYRALRALADDGMIVKISHGRYQLAQLKAPKRLS